jgi:hypothetical protein
MDNVVNLNPPTPTAPDEEFSVLIQNEIYTVRRKSDYPYRLVLNSAGEQRFVLPIEFPVTHADTAIRAYIAGLERGQTTGRNEIRDGLKKLLRMENAP